MLDAWSDAEWNNGVQIDKMEELTTLTVRTRNSLYEITVLNGRTGDVLLDCGSTPTRRKKASSEHRRISAHANLGTPDMNPYGPDGVPNPNARSIGRNPGLLSISYRGREVGERLACLADDLDFQLSQIIDAVTFSD